MDDVFRVYRRELYIFSVFFAVGLIIVLLHLLFHPVRVLGMDTSIFYMDEKYTLAAFFSVVTAFLVGFLSLTNPGSKKQKIRWLANLAYGLFFVMLAIDEYFEIHEYTNSLVKASVKSEGVVKTLVNLSWVFPLSIVIFIVFSLFFIKFMQSRRELKLPISLGVGCFALVLVFELFGSATYGKDIYVYFVAIEEGLEMVGASFFLLATLIENKMYNKPL